VWRVSRVFSRHRVRCAFHVDRRGLSEIERSSFREGSDDYAFHRSGVTLLARGTSVTQTFGRCDASPVSSAASGLTPCSMSSPMSVDRIVRDRAKSFPLIGRLCVPSLGRHTVVARNACYVGVRAVRRVSRVVSGIRADTVSEVQPNVDRHGLWRVSRGNSLLLHHLGHSWRA
jgi:hypothetical protein